MIMGKRGNRGTGRGPRRPDLCLSPAEFPELVLGATGTEDLTRRARTELGASKMADEALAGLDEGALRKLVSGPIVPNARPERRGLLGCLSSDQRR